jgi:predicted RNA-binding Zn-ribbon protein involved in translation (DUF1610 family)
MTWLFHLPGRLLEVWARAGPLRVVRITRTICHQSAVKEVTVESAATDVNILARAGRGQAPNCCVVTVWAVHMCRTLSTPSNFGTRRFQVSQYV